MDINEDDIAQIFYASQEAGNPVAKSIISNIIETLRLTSPYGSCDSIDTRHVWDEYSWLLENIPVYDFYNYYNYQHNYKKYIENIIIDELEKLFEHTKVFLTSFAYADYYDNGYD